MIEKPNISETLIVECLKTQYGIDDVTLEFLPIGNDVNSAVYKVATKNAQLYLKLRKNDFTKASVKVPHLLKENGITQVIAPILTTTQEEWIMLGEYYLSLYPYVEGQNGFQHALSHKQWIELGTAVKGLHALQVPQDLHDSIPYETYSSFYIDSVKKLLQQINTKTFSDTVAAEMAKFMIQNEDKVIHIIERAETLRTQAKTQKPKLVLCHADLHGANVLIDKHDHLYIVDWDTLVFAPKERDLMFIGAGVGGYWNKEEEKELFYKGYGITDINHAALTYYRYERILEDIVEFEKRLLVTNEGGKDREHSLEKFKKAFEPNNVVERAIREENF